jgi:hypothetical protein
VVELVPAVVDHGLGVTGQLAQAGLRGLAMPAHPTLYGDVGNDAAGSKRLAEEPRLLPARLGEHVVVRRPPGRLTMPHQQQLTH